MNKARQGLFNKKAEIDAALTFTGIVHRLPGNEQDAKRVLFLLHLPPCFQHLAVVGIEAQAKLWKEAPMSGALWNWTDIRQEGAGCEGRGWAGLSYIYQNLSFFYTRTATRPPTQQIDTWTLEGSVAHPSGHSALPFGCDVFTNATSTNIFRAGLFCAATARRELKDAVNLPPKAASADRGNLSLASQFGPEAREQGWPRPAYHTFWAVRADPNLQLRRIVEVFQEKDFPLPLSHPDVQTLLRMSVFHTGPLEANLGGNRAVARVNALDLEDEAFLQTLVCTLRSMSAQLGAEAQKDPASLSIVAELLAYLASRRCVIAITAAQEVARAGEVAAESVNKRLARLLEMGGDSREERRLEAVRQTLFCHSLATIDSIRSDKDAERFCRLLLAARAATPSSSTKVLAEESVAARAFQDARRIAATVLPSLLARLPRVGDEAAPVPFLTRALFALRNRTGLKEDEVKWAALAPRDAGLGPTMQDAFSACFEAVLPAETQGGVAVRCSVNLASGESLIDGLPPGRLPEAVTEAPNYRRIFERRSFKVDGDGPGAFRTMHNVGGRAYRFVPAQSPHMLPRIFELSPAHGDEDATWLELLPLERDLKCIRGATVDPPILRWDSRLPTRLATLYSAWHVPGHDCVLLRGPFAFNGPQLFNKRQVAFVVNSKRCKRPHGAQPLRHLVRLKRRVDYDELLACPLSRPAPEKPLPASVVSVLRALNGIERTEFIHVFRTETAVRVELPRFVPDVAFVTNDDGKWRSCERLAYILAPDQLETASLRGFGAYVSLQLDTTAAEAGGEERLRLPSRMLLMLEGTVVPGAAREQWMPAVGLATVQKTSRPDDEVRLVSVSRDDAQSCWSVSNVRDRIQLAAVLAYTDTSIPDATGLPAAHALELIRASAFEHLDDTALRALENCQRAAWSSPSLQLRCFQLQQDAAALNFCVDGDVARSKDHPHQSEAGPCCDGAAVSYYETVKAKLDLAPQLLLTAEEARQVGVVAEDCEWPVTVSCPCDTLVEDVDRNLSRLVTPLTEAQNGSRDLADTELSRLCAEAANLKIKGSGTALVLYFAEEAKRSRRALQGFAPARLLDGAPAHAIQMANVCLVFVERRMAELKRKIEELFGAFTDSCSSGAVDTRRRKTRLARVRSRTAPPSTAELLRLTWQREQANALAPPGIEPTDAWYTEVRKAVLSWAQLLACKQRLCRIQIIADMASDAQNGTACPATADHLRARDLLLHELQASRRYDVGTKPWWLAMEISGNLAIRPRQLAVTLRMRHCNRSNVQLNMGEGKSSVILPLLMLDFAFSPEQSLPRAIFPPALLSTGVDVLRRRLTQGPARLPVIPLPFQRNAKLDRSNVRVLERLLLRTIRYGGVAAVAPNDVLSMHLKCDELALTAGRRKAKQAPDVSLPSGAEALRYVLLNAPWADVLDESDESLRPSYQLIYAYGNRRPLPHAGLRCACIRWLLRLLREAWNLPEAAVPEEADSGRRKQGALRALKCTLIPPWCETLDAAAQGVQHTGHGVGAHPTLTLNSNAPDADILSAQASAALFDALLAYESLEFKALCEMYDALPKPQQEGIKEYVTVGTSTLDVLPDDIAAEVKCVWDRDRHAGKNGEDKTGDSTTAPTATTAADKTGDTVAVARMLLMLRGLLGHGLLFYGLGRRPQVHYGKDPKRPKKVAVPFRAHNKPDPRSDFASADTALLLTHFTYFYLGLTSEELKEAVQMLQRLPRGRQESIYKTWYTTAQLGEHADPALIGATASSLNLSHEQQWSVLKKHLSFNAEVITFWLEFCVVSRDMMQFPARLMATPWTLVDERASRHRVGFSGTDDTHLLMPDTMQNVASSRSGSTPGQLGSAYTLEDTPQCELEALTATGAHMDSILLQQRVQLLPDDGRMPRWEALLTLAKADAGGNIDAILDAGALLAGATAEKAAEWLCEKELADRHEGVMYWQDADHTTGTRDTG